MTDLDATRLSAWARTHLPELAEPLSIEKFAGGQSNPTYRIETGGAPVVLRRQPFGALLPSAHAVDREYRVLAALHPTGFPVPRPLAFCSDPSVIGSMFYVMALAPGRSFWNGALPEVAPGDRNRVYRAMITTQARLHQIDPASIGLEGFGPSGGYLERQVERWTRQYRATQTDLIPAIENLIDWLPRTIPSEGRTAIVHGDFRIDNLIYDPLEPEVRAVLDWELATLGDPLADFAYLAMNWVLQADGGPGLGGVDLAAAGIPDLDEAVALYCRLTDRPQPPDLHWYFAFNLFRLAGILQGVKKRSLEGNASSTSADTAIARLEPLAAAGWNQALLAGAR